ncbi:MAG: hypothetical protein Q9224_006541 [Gallowayella concinna]
MAQRQPDHQGLANQGQPLGSTSQGMKIRLIKTQNTQNTTDSSTFQNPISESAGPIASDSLAAESTNAGGAFSSNRNANPQSVSGDSSTFNNTDTSGARVLDAAPDAAEREAKEAWREVPDEARGSAGKKYPEGAGEVEFSGTHNADGYSGGSTSSTTTTTESGRQEGSGDDGYAPSGIRGGAAPGTEGDGSSSSSSASNKNAEDAPGYIASVHSEAAQTGKPHGQNITEGGFESDDSKNASFTSEIGSENDPGRAAEEQFQTTAQAAAGGKGEVQRELTKDGQFDVLETDQSL